MPRPMTIETSIPMPDHEGDIDIVASVDESDIYDVEVSVEGVALDFASFDERTKDRVYDAISKEYHREVANRAADRADLLGILRGGW